MLIINAKIVDSGTVRERDLRIEGSRIANISSSLSARENEHVVDAKGKLLLPGLIDDQVHMREPGLTHKGDLQSETRAAAAGGITTVFEMPNTKPPTLDSAALEAKYQRAAEVSAVNYAFYLGASNDNLEAIKALDPTAAAGVKVFMGASTGSMLVDDPHVLDQIFAHAPTLIATHCEYQASMDAGLLAAKARYGDNIPVQEHPNIRSREACKQSTEIAIGLAKRHGARLHVLHITTAEELELFEAGPMIQNGRCKSITAETCVHFLHFDARDYDRLGNLIKCNPAIKLASDREALIAALHSGQIDILATDHAPHLLEEKSQSYERAPGGLPLVQHALQCVLQRVSEGQLSYPMAVEKFCHAPALLFDVVDRGFVREGYFADLVLVEAGVSHQVQRQDVLAKCGWSPFEGEVFSHAVRSTWVNGQLVFDGKKVDTAVRGQRVQFLR